MSTFIVSDKAYLGTVEGSFLEKIFKSKEFFQKQVICEYQLGKAYLGT